MKKLVLYSDQVPEKSDDIDKVLVQMINKKNPKIAYIPSQSDLTRKYFNQKIDYYSRIGIHDLMYFDIDIEYNSLMLDKLLACDAIHLSGGDTGHFLSSMKKRGFLEVLRQYVFDGGVLIGISAGSIIMSRNIDVINILDGEKSELCCTDALNLVGFEFVPHWERNNGNLDKIKQYSKQRGTDIYVCNDSDGIVVSDDKVRFIGSVLLIRNGNIIYL